MPKRGKLIVFEGPDGVGKSTLAAALARRLRLEGFTCEQLSFPGQDEGSLGRLVYHLHHHPSQLGVSSISPSSVQLLHVAAHVDLIERRVLPLLHAREWVILDRYWWSTWVYGKVSGVSDPFLDALVRLEEISWRGIRPECVILLLRHLSKQGEGAGDHSKLTAAYRTIAKRQVKFHRIRIVEDDRDSSEILDEIYGAIIVPLHRRRRRSTSGDGPKTPQSREPVWNLGQISNTPSQIGEPTKKRRAPHTFSKLCSPIPTEVYETYWRFAFERQEIFFRRIAGQQPPLSRDPILQRYKFTNAYRASDRVSQFLISRVIYRGDQNSKEVFFRTLLFKLFNRIETWQILERAIGELRWAGYSFQHYDEALTRAIADGDRIYSAAYIMPPVRRNGLDRKHRGHLGLLELMMADGVPLRVGEADSMRHVFQILRSYAGIGSFLAYQFAIDLNYSEMVDFSEMEFVVPGPGALEGIHKCFQSLGDLSEADIIKFMAERQSEEFANYGLVFRSLWGRPLQLVDCQSLFCEVGKYARVAHPHMRGGNDRTRIKQVYRPSSPQMSYWYPPKWGLNQLIASEKATYGD